MAEQKLFAGSCVERRPMSDAERAELRKSVGPAHEAVVQILQMAAWGLGSIGAITYLCRDVQWARRCGIALFALAGCYYLCILIAELIQGPRLAKKLRADLAAGEVEVRSLRLLAAKRFVEPEHGGFFYFLRTDDERVYVTFDWESQALHEMEKDPLSSTFTPAMHLQVVRAPRTGRRLKEQFSGTPLDLPVPTPLTDDSEDWPEIGEFFPVAWQDVDSKFSAPPDNAPADRKRRRPKSPDQ